MKQLVKGGTPNHEENLCLSCSYSARRVGHSISQEEVFCRAFNDDGYLRVPFKIAECTSYSDKNQVRADSFYSTGWTYIPTKGFFPPDGIRAKAMHTTWLKRMFQKIWS